MLINVGTKWEKENIPSQIKNSRSLNQKNKGSINDNKKGVVYSLDFIELADVLFKKYPLNDDIFKLEKKSDISKSDLEPYIPKSNWERFFNKIVEVESDHLKIKWEKLYDYRCKIAHNNHFKLSDYEQVCKIIEDIKPNIEKAIQNLDKISVNEAEKEAIAENVASIKNETIGKLIIVYNKLETTIYGLRQVGEQRRLPLIRMLDFVLDEKLITDELYKNVRRLVYYRNRIVHGDLQNEINEELVNELIDETVAITENLSQIKGDSDDVK